jgi:hypothetical protein
MNSDKITTHANKKDRQENTYIFHASLFRPKSDELRTELRILYDAFSNLYWSLSIVWDV